MRLRTLFIVIAIAALLCWFHELIFATQRCRENASNELRRRGVFVAGDLHTVGMGGPHATNESLAKVAHLVLNCGGPESLDLTDSQITDLTIVAKMQRLKWLYLDGSGVDDESLQALVGMRHLSFVGLFGTKVTDACIPILCSMPRLKKVMLVRTRVTKQGVDHLREAVPGIDVSWSEEASGTEGKSEH